MQFSTQHTTDFKLVGRLTLEIDVDTYLDESPELELSEASAIVGPLTESELSHNWASECDQIFGN